MVVPDPENVSQGEVESSVQQQPDQTQNRNQPAAFASIRSQSSIYSLTLDEFQHTLVESGKNFGSMNMDEFLTSIWTAEENQAFNGGNNNNGGNSSSNINGSNNSHHHHHQLGLGEITADKGIARQPSLTRQGSLTLPAPLCQKTVDEVWSEIHKGQVAPPPPQPQQQTLDNNPESAARQTTFGEMTLEDFLIKAGVVREGEGSVEAPPRQPQYGIYHENNSPQVGPSYVNRPAMGVIGSGGGVAVAGAPAIPTYQTMPQASTSYGEASVYAGNGGYPPQAAVGPLPPLTAPVPCYGGRVVNGGYAAAQPLALPAPPMSPVSSDGICGSQVDNSGNQYGMDMVGIRGRKRIIDGPVEKVVERRQRRMIKNRESAARSRARKQAYTVELETELNQLREENAQLKHALTELHRKRKQQYIEEMKMKIQTRAFKAKDKERGIRRNLSF
ncbi:hypothetical protein UlMin_005551 [Ulmus minor]